MDTALPRKFPFILDRNLAKANCTENDVCTSCDKVVLELYIIIELKKNPVQKINSVYSNNIKFIFYSFSLSITKKN